MADLSVGSTSHSKSRAAGLVIAAAIVVGLIARAVAVSYAPLNSYKPDHRDNMTWSAYAWEHAPWKIYNLPARALILERGALADGVIGIGISQAPHACNYPPLSAYVFWLQGGLWTLLDSQVQILAMPREHAEALGVQQVSGRVIETPAARIAQAVPAVLFDVPLAFGVAAIVAAVRRVGRWSLSEAIALSICFLAPPIVLDSSYWNQTDSWIATPLVWAVWALLTERLTLAGVFWGAALMIKPQGILFAPILAYVFLARFVKNGGGRQQALQLWKTVAGAAAVGLIVTLPFMMADANTLEGPLRWFRRSYVATLGAGEYQRTTLNAFNLWWLHWMWSEGSADALDASRSTIGVSRSLLGKGLLSAAIVALAAACAWRFAWRSVSILWLTAGVFLAAFVLPTSVHERYIFYCIPFFVALAALSPRRWIGPLLIILVVGTAEMLAFQWVRPVEAWVRSLTTGLAAASVVVLAWTFAAIVTTRWPSEEAMREGGH